MHFHRYSVRKWLGLIFHRPSQMPNLSSSIRPGSTTAAYSRFRDQVLTPEQHIAFSRRLGELEEHVVGQFLLEGHPHIYRVSTKVDEDGKPMGNPESGRYWHSDLSYLELPSKASLLYALEVPPSGGDTMLTSMYAAYESLSDKNERNDRRADCGA